MHYVVRLNFMDVRDANVKKYSADNLSRQLKCGCHNEKPQPETSPSFEQRIVL